VENPNKINDLVSLLVGIPNCSAMVAEVRAAAWGAALKPMQRLMFLRSRAAPFVVDDLDLTSANQNCAAECK
jgi:hypothetical protein